jgi:protein-S-isoprenylcysteine O-methyltransferase Ste14
MPNYIGPLTIVLMLGMVLARVVFLKARGVRAMRFGETDKTDFLIPPFALFYFYIVFAAAFGWPTIAHRALFHSHIASWAGALCCVLGLILLSWSLISFGRSFRVGIDTDQPDKLVTSGIFAYSRNPIYVAFFVILTGQFLIFPHPITLVAVVVATFLFHRQVLREEQYLQEHYGREFAEYRARVRRYV